jgi:hypothetical protein
VAGIVTLLFDWRGWGGYEPIKTTAKSSFNVFPVCFSPCIHYFDRLASDFEGDYYFIFQEKLGKLHIILVAAL